MKLGPMARGCANFFFYLGSNFFITQLFLTLLDRLVIQRSSEMKYRRCRDITREARSHIEIRGP